MWIDNEDGTFTAVAGDTLYDLYGEDWQSKSGFTRDPRTLQIGETVGYKNICDNSKDFIDLNNIQNSDNDVTTKGQIMIGLNLNFVACIGFDVSIGFLFNLDDSTKSGLFLSGGFASGVSAGVSIFGGYNFGSMDAKNLATVSTGYGPIGGNFGVDSNGDFSFNGSFSPIGLDAGLNLSIQHMIVLPFATEEEKEKMMERYYEHH